MRELRSPDGANAKVNMSQAETISTYANSKMSTERLAIFKELRK